MTHTPGPWRPIKASSIGRVIGIYDADGGVIAKTGNRASAVHDACLISVAPELLQALEQMAEMWVSVCNPRGWEPEHMSQYVKASAAIKKARGEA